MFLQIEEVFMQQNKYNLFMQDSKILTVSSTSMPSLSVAATERRNGRKFGFNMDGLLKKAFYSKHTK